MISSNLLKKILAFGSTDILAKAFPFILMPFLTYYLMPNDFALATNYMVLSGLFNALIGLSGYTYFGANFFSDYKKEQLLLDIFVLNLIITLISLILVAAFHGYLETVFKLSLIWQLMALFTGLFLHFIEMTITFLRFDSKLRVYSLYQISNAIISTLLTVIFVIVLNWTWQGRIYSLLITPLVFGFSGIYILKNNFNFLKLMII